MASGRCDLPCVMLPVLVRLMLKIDCLLLNAKPLRIATQQRSGSCTFATPGMAVARAALTGCTPQGVGDVILPRRCPHERG